MFGMIAMTMLGCHVDFENRRLPEPTFYAEDVFGQGRPGVGTTTEVAVEDPFGELSLRAEQPNVDTQNLKNIALVGMVKSSLPHTAMGGGWSEATTSSEFLLIHETESQKGTYPNVIIYGYYDPTSATDATLSSRRFLSTVDPAFEQTGLWQLSPFISSVVSALSIDSPISPDSLESLLSVFQPTLGIGLGYQSFSETFTGWKWIGQNQHGVLLSLGKTKGKFVQVTDGIRSGIQQFQGMNREELLENIEELYTLKQTVSQVSGMKAEMIVGSVTYQQQTMYLSMMCVTQPTCVQQEELIDFLNNLSPLLPSDTIASSLYDTPVELGQRYDLPLFQSGVSTFSDTVATVEEQLTKYKNNDATSIFYTTATGQNQVNGLETVEGEGIEADEEQNEQVPVGNDGAKSGQGDSGY